MANGAIAKYSYVVMVFQIIVVILFTVLYADKQGEIDSECTSTPLQTWWIVSLSFAYLGTVVGIMCSFTKEVLDYRRKKIHKVDEEFA